MSGSEFPVTLLDLAGSIALLLWGVRMVQTGVQRAFGARLRSALSTALLTPSKAQHARSWQGRDWARANAAGASISCLNSSRHSRTHPAWA